MLITTLTEMVKAFEAECGVIDTVGVGVPGLVTHDGVRARQILTEWLTSTSLMSSGRQFASQ